MKMLGCFVLLIFLAFQVTGTSADLNKSQTIESPLTDELFKFMNHFDDNMIGFHLVEPKNDGLDFRKPSPDLKNVLEYVNQISFLRNMMERDPDTKLKIKKNCDVIRKSHDKEADHFTDLFLFSQPMKSLPTNKSDRLAVPVSVQSSDISSNPSDVVSSPKHKDTVNKPNDKVKTSSSIYPFTALNQKEKSLNITPEDVSFLGRFSRQVNNKDRSRGFSVFPCSDSLTNPSNHTSHLILRNDVWDSVNGPSNLSDLTAYISPPSDSCLPIQGTQALVETDSEDQLESEHIDNNFLVTRQHRRLPKFYKCVSFEHSSDRVKPFGLSNRSKRNLLINNPALNDNFNSLINNPSVNVPSNLNWINPDVNVDGNKESYVNELFNKKINDIMSLVTEKRSKYVSKKLNKNKIHKPEWMGYRDGRVGTIESDGKVTIDLHPIKDGKDNIREKNNGMKWKRIKKEEIKSTVYHKGNSTITMPVAFNEASELVKNKSDFKGPNDRVVREAKVGAFPFDVVLLSNRSNRSININPILPSQEKDINLLITYPLHSESLTGDNPVRKRYSSQKQGMTPNFVGKADNEIYLVSDLSQAEPHLKFRLGDSSNASIVHRIKNMRYFDPIIDSYFNYKSKHFNRITPTKNYFKSLPSKASLSTEPRSNISNSDFKLLSKSVKKPEKAFNRAIKLENVTINLLHGTVTPPVNNLKAYNAEKPVFKPIDPLVFLTKPSGTKVYPAAVSNITKVNDAANITPFAVKTPVSVRPSKSANLTSQISNSLASTPRAYVNASVASKPLLSVKSVTQSFLQSKTTADHKINTTRSHSDNCALTSNGTIVVKNGSMQLRHNHTILFGKSKVELLQMPSGEILQFFNSSTENPLFSYKITNNEVSASPDMISSSSAVINSSSTNPTTQAISSKEPEQFSTIREQFTTYPSQFASPTTQYQPTYNYCQPYSWNNAYNWSSYYQNYYKQFPYHNASNYYYCNTYKPAILATNDYSKEPTTSCYEEEEAETSEENLDYYPDFSPVISVNIFPVVQNWKKPHMEGLALVKELFRSSPTILKGKEPEKLPNYLSELIDNSDEKSKRRKLKLDNKVQRKLETILSGKYSLNDVYKYKLQNILQGNSKSCEKIS